MQISEAWLRNYVNPAVSTEELVAQLTMAGLEVDSVAPAAAQFSGVVVAEVMAMEQHPDAGSPGAVGGHGGGGRLSGAGSPGLATQVIDRKRLVSASFADNPP